MKQIGFTNFRRFEQFPTLGINDLTFLVGSNNSGKSTMVKAILLVYDNLRSLHSYQKDGKWDTPNFKFDANMISVDTGPKMGKLRKSIWRSLDC